MSNYSNKVLEVLSKNISILASNKDTMNIIRNIAKRKGGVPPNLEEIIAKELLSIRLK